MTSRSNLAASSRAIAVAEFSRGATAQANRAKTLPLDLSNLFKGLLVVESEVKTSDDVGVSRARLQQCRKPETGVTWNCRYLVLCSDAAFAYVIRGLCNLRRKLRSGDPDAVNFCLVEADADASDQRVLDAEDLRFVRTRLNELANALGVKNDEGH